MVGFAKCDPAIVNKITGAANYTPPDNILETVDKYQPWAVSYATEGAFPSSTRSVFMSRDSLVVVTTNGDETTSSYSWVEKAGVLTDGSKKLYVLTCNTQVLSFYMCDENGEPGPPNAVVALGVGPPGGVPDEVKTAASEARKKWESIGINLKVHYDLNAKR